MLPPQNKQAPWYFYCGVLLGLLMSAYYSMHQILAGDQIQMLQKGYLAAHHGIWVHYGNAASVMGNVPGTLSTLLIALPLKIVDSPYSPIILLLILRLIGFLLFDAIIKKVFSLQVRILFLLICWLNPWFQFESILYNPAYLFFCSALHFWTAYKLRSCSNWFHSFLHILSIGLALQLHYSWPLLVLISSYLYIKKHIKIDWMSVATATILIILSLIPYFNSVIHEPALLKNASQEADKRYIGWGGIHVYPVLKSLLYWFRYASFLYPNKLLDAVSFNWLTSHENLRLFLIYLWKAITYTVGVVTLIFSSYVNFIYGKKFKSLLFSAYSTEKIHIEMWVMHYTFGSLSAVIIAAILSPIVFIYWHLMLVFPFALFPVLSMVDNKYFSYKWVNLFFIICLLYFIMVNIVASIDSKKYSIDANFKEQTVHYLKENKL